MCKKFISFVLLLSGMLLTSCSPRKSIKDKYYKKNVGRIIFADQTFKKQPLLKSVFTVNEKVYIRVYFKDTLDSLYSKADISCNGGPEGQFFFALNINNQEVGMEKKFPAKVILDKPTYFNKDDFESEVVYPSYWPPIPLYSKLSYKRDSNSMGFIGDNFFKYGLSKLKVGENKIKLSLYSYCGVDRKNSTVFDYVCLPSPISEGTFTLKISNKKELDLFKNKMTRNFPPSNEFLTKDKYPNQSEFKRISSVFANFKGKVKPLNVSMQTGWKYNKNEYGVLLNRIKYGYVKMKGENNRCFVNEFQYNEQHISNNRFNGNGSMVFLGYQFVSATPYENDFWIPCDK